MPLLHDVYDDDDDNITVSKMAQINMSKLRKREASFSVISAFLLYISQYLRLAMTLLVET